MGNLAQNGVSVEKTEILMCFVSRCFIDVCAVCFLVFMWFSHEKQCFG